MRGVTGADLLLFREVVETLLHGQKIRKRAAAALAALVAADVSLLGVVTGGLRRGLELGLVEKVPLLAFHPLAARPKALRLRQALPFLEERDPLVLLVDRRLLRNDQLLKRFNRGRNVGARHARNLTNANRLTTPMHKKGVHAV